MAKFTELQKRVFRQEPKPKRNTEQVNKFNESVRNEAGIRRASLQAYEEQQERMNRDDWEEL